MDTSVNIKSAKNTLITFVVFTVFAGIFATIYEHFSHQVYSNAMIYSFVFPLVLGALPFGIFLILKGKHMPGDFERFTYSFGVITLMVGSIFKGVLEIYGTTNSLVYVYYILGGTLTLFGILVYIAKRV